MKKEILLGYWNNLVSNNNMFCVAKFDDDMSSIEAVEFVDSFQEGISGFYAKYPEGLFYVFLDDEGRVCLSWRGRVVKLAEVESIKCRSYFYGRYFCISGSDSGTLMSFRYHTLLGRMFSPKDFWADLLDDDWGLAADLPQFIESCFRSGDLEERLKCLVKRN